MIFKWLRYRVRGLQMKRNPLVMLEPPRDGARNEWNLPPTISVTAEENVLIREVALSSVEPEEPSAA